MGVRGFFDFQGFPQGTKEGTKSWCPPAKFIKKEARRFDYESITGNRSAIEINDNIKNVEEVPIETEEVPIETGKVPIETEEVPIVNLSTQQRTIFQFVKKNGKITSSQVETLLEVKQRRARSILSGMVDLGILERQGSYRRTTYVLKDEFRNRELEFGIKSR